MTEFRIPFNRPYMTGKELDFIAEAHSNGVLAGDGRFTRLCNRWLEGVTGCKRAFLTHSCTAALEMAAILADIKPGDEVIMPSFTFVSTANAFVLRGATPVFVDVRADTLNIDETIVESAITPKTKAVVPVHYAGIACEMHTIMEIALRHKLLVIEDAAQGIMSSYDGRVLGSIGHMGAYSFHETKDIISGEGGALLVNDDRYLRRAEVILEKGTNRSEFFRGEADKYTWIDIGSSYLPGEITAAFLWGQAGEAESIIATRMSLWDRYHAAFAQMEADGKLRRPAVPEGCCHNAHIYFILLPSRELRTRLIEKLARDGINAVFHFVPLHGSPAGNRFGRVHGSMQNTDDLAGRLLRLPLWVELSESDQDQVVESIRLALND